MTHIRHRTWGLLPALAFTLAAHAVPIAGQGSWESTLHPRDIDGDGTADFSFQVDTAVPLVAADFLL